MPIYGEHITGDQLTDYLDEISTEIIIPDADLPDASFPLQDALEHDFYKDDGMVDSGFPSNIPNKINKLNIFHEDAIIPTNEEILSVILLKNKMDKNITVAGNYNGVCVDLDTTNYNLKIETGSSVAAL